MTQFFSRVFLKVAALKKTTRVLSKVRADRRGANMGVGGDLMIFPKWLPDSRMFLDRQAADTISERFKVASVSKMPEM